MAYYELRKYTSVSNSSSYTESYVIEENCKLYINEMGGNAVYNQDVKVEVIWDSEILLATHGDCVQKCNIEIIGNGVKSLKIKLTNDSSQSETIGGYLIAERYL